MTAPPPHDKNNDVIDGEALLAVLTALNQGDFSKRMPDDLTGLAHQVAVEVNHVADMVARNEVFASAIAKIAREGKLDEALSEVLPPIEEQIDVPILAENINIPVLIVDDNPNKMAITTLLENMNVQIFTVDSGQEALKSLLQHDFAVVLLDVNMPIFDGFETAKLIRQRPRSEQLPIIFITAERFTDDERLNGYELGGVDYLCSPISPSVLRAKVQVFADLYRYRKATELHNQEIIARNVLVAKQNRLLADINKALEGVNINLEKRIAEEMVRSHEKDEIMIHQSRLALMGEMIGNIAHQWRQPLNALGLVLGNIQDADEYHELDSAYVARKVGEGEELIQKMSATIDDFRNFFRPDKDIKPFCLNEAVADAVSLVKSSFTAHSVNIVVGESAKLWSVGVPNEYAQVILNLLSNAKEAVLAKKEAIRGEVLITLVEDDGQAVVTVKDNGGGISAEAMPRIFDPYFSTKKTGTGIGLYMSKMIVETSMGGEIKARNVDGGVEFTVKTPLSAAT